MLFREPEDGAIDGKWSREPIRLRALRLRRDEVASYVKQVNRLSQDIGDKNAFLQRFCFY